MINLEGLDLLGEIAGVSAEERMRDGGVQYRDAMGRLTGSATAPRR